MTSPLRAFNTDWGRYYHHPSFQKGGGKGKYAPNPSITNVMKVLDEGFLPGYYSKLVATYAVENMEEVAELISTLSPQAAIDMLREVPYQPHPNSAIGDEVHYAVEQHVRKLHGLPYEVPKLSTITAKRMLAQWLEFVRVHQPDIHYCEYNVWSYKHGYAGTGDLLMEVNGELHIVDLKSGTRIYPKVGMQTAAAKRADSLITFSGTEIDMPAVHKTSVLHIRPMSIKLFEIEHEEDNWKAFLACRELFSWVQLAGNEETPILPFAPLIEVKASVKGITAPPKES